MLCFCYNITN